MRSALVSVALLVACGSKQPGSQVVHSPAATSSEAAPQTTSVSPPTESKTMTAPGRVSTWFCFTIGRHAADTQCESSEADCTSLLATVRQAVPQAAAKASCAAHDGAVFCFEEVDNGGTARLCSDTRAGCDDARKGAAAQEANTPTGTKIGTCSETR